jgi:hypothetical protein
MADIVLTAANIIPGTGAIFATGIAGATITQGQPVYLDTSTGTIKLADANLSQAAATVAGIAINSALANQQVSYQTAGTLAFGAILTAGKVYVNSATGGAIAPVADLASGWYTTILGVASSTSNLVLSINNTLIAN